MSNGDEPEGEDALRGRLEDAAAALEDAETEADLDEVEAQLDAIEEDIAEADLPEPEEEDEEGPREELETELSDLRDRVADERGPYAEDVAEQVDETAAEIRDTRWTEQGAGEVAEAVEAFLGDVGDALGEAFSAEGETPGDYADALEDASAAVADAGLDADDDAETIQALVEAADALETGIDEAQAWSDLTTREKLDAQGFYDTLTPENRKDFPPELTAVRIAEQENDPETILLALDMMEADFMEENCLDALRRMGPQEAYDEMLQRAGKREKPAVEILGKIGDPDAVDTLVEYVDADIALEKVTLKALGEIGSEEATQAIANRLVAENAEIRSYAARALGRIGDTRAIDPLADALADDDDDAVRASAAWALRQIGTERALEAAAEYTDDRSYIVQSEADAAADALGTDEPAGDGEPEPEAAD